MTDENKAKEIKMELIMIKDHLNYLKNINNNEQRYFGNNSLKWAESVLKDINIAKIDNQNINIQFNRDQLFEYCENKNNSDFNTLISILSWGGMRRNNGRDLFSNKQAINKLLMTIKKLRRKEYYSRSDAFQVFHELRLNNELHGLGAGYFTKLICFLAPELNGYIMDQWVSKSVNLLAGKEIVFLTSNSWVNDRNDHENYELFCRYIDKIGVDLDCTGFKAEERLFSIGGKNKGDWRSYLIKNYKP